ncbi:lyase family protein [Pelomonas sp. CA6]|uniref:lyase family protein n=1 Tax=Pelomonas sp. CA6 TaxID=2907999 RepID=UPI001F4BFFFC|nr:lyase family protein [Pelomonas sp. CA6]MCH7343826.1 lyase family protein [Pelomonas sp. CA6]
MTVMVFEAFISTPQMQAVYAEGAVAQALMDVEAAVARVQARLGLIPSHAGQAIASLCRAELYDVPAIMAAAARRGGPAQPLVQKLRETVALFDPVAAGYVHWGCTDQDLVDTAQALLTQRALRLIDEDLLQLCGHLLDLAEREVQRPMLTRIQLRPDSVQSLRAKIVTWLAPLLRSAQALRSAARDTLMLQLGGLGGAQVAWGSKDDALREQVAGELHLGCPATGWHSQRDRGARLGAELGLLCMVLGKLAQDLTLLSQPEVDELDWPATTASGTQIGCTPALSAARRAPQRVSALLACMPQVLEHEAGAWHAELAEWAGLMLSAHGSVHALVQVLASLRIKPARMLSQIEAQSDLVFQAPLRQLLTDELGRSRAEPLMDDLLALVRDGQGPLRRLAQGLLGEGAPLAGRMTPARMAQVFDVDAAAARADARAVGSLQQARSLWAELCDSAPF